MSTPRKTSNGKRPTSKREKVDKWELRLYIAGQTPNSIAAIGNLRRICEERLQGRYRIEIVDLLEKPQLAKGDQIVAIPTLVRKLPAPVKKIVGNLSIAERALVGLDLLRVK
jgi:circadian clock protein KaiB